MPKTVSLTCPQCGESFEKPLNSYRADLKRRGGPFYCSIQCVGVSQRKQVTRPCRWCGTPITRQPAHLRGGPFCNHSCRAQFHNRRRGRKTNPSSLCGDCGKSFPSKHHNSRKVCDTCKTQRWLDRPGKRTKGDLFGSRKNWLSARSTIQKHARRTFQPHNPDPVCGAAGCRYTKHLQVAHRRAVSDFPDTTLVCEINDPANLVGLCPTHHWEFDHDTLDQPLP